MKRIQLMLALVLCLVVIVGNGNALAKKIIIKFPSTHASADALLNIQGAKVGEVLEELMPGVFDLKVYAGSSLGDEREVLEGLRLGSIEMTGSGVSGIADPIMLIFDMPFLFRNRDHAYSVLDGEVGQELLNNFKDPRLVAIGYFENGWRHITNNVRPVKHPDDVKGLKQRVVEHDVYLRTMRALGANVTPMPYSELYLALKTGVVDGQDNPLSNIYTSKFNEVQKYLSLTGHVYSNSVVLCSRIFWDKLTADQQAAIRKAVKIAAEYSRELSVKKDNELANKLKEGGMMVNEIENKGPFIKATQVVYDDLSDRFPPELVKRIRETKVVKYPYTD